MTDTGALPDVRGKFTKILIEANHARWSLMNSGIDHVQKLRVAANHLSVEQTIEFLKKNPAPEVWLIHISDRHGDGAEFVRLVQGVTGLEKVFAA